MNKPHDLGAGVRRFLKFNKLDVNEVGPFNLDRLPEWATLLGRGKWISYRSDKWEGKFHNYIHDHKAGVNYYRPHWVANDNAVAANDNAVPTSIVNSETLVLLGQCLGFRHLGAPEHNYMHGSRPNLYCTANGRCLVIVSGKSRIVAMAWGGSLDVQARGIVG